MTAVEGLISRSDGVDLSAMYEAILEIRRTMVQPASRPRRPPAAPLPRTTTATTIPPNSTTYTPTILDYMFKLQAPAINYACSGPNTLKNYVRDQRMRNPPEFMDEQEIWDIFRDIIVQVNQKCASGNWSGEFSEGIPFLNRRVIEDMIVYDIIEGQRIWTLKTPVHRH